MAEVFEGTRQQLEIALSKEVFTTFVALRTFSLKNLRNWNALMGRPDVQEPINTAISVYDLTTTSEQSIYLHRLISVSAVGALFNNASCPYPFEEPTSASMSFLNLLSTEGCSDTILVNLLQTADIQRVAALLRLLGFYRIDPSNVFQLSLGAASGEFDLHWLHSLSRITLESNQEIHFSNQFRDSKNAVLIDINEKWGPTYKFLSESQGYHCFVGDMYEVLRNLSSKDFQIDLVTALRIDPKMIPDVPKFFSSFRRLINGKAQFIVTIGAGNSVQEFDQRLRKMGEISAYLSSIGLNPKRIILHGSGNSEEQRNKPLFGAPFYATYEVIYCDGLTKPKKRHR